MTKKHLSFYHLASLLVCFTNILRTKNVVGKFVEFFGPGLENLTISERATIANMASLALVLILLARKWKTR